MQLGILMNIEQIIQCEQKVYDGQPKDKGPVPMKGCRAEDPVVAVRAPDEPSPRHNTITVGTVMDFLSCLDFPEFNIFFQ